jgi:hypothetical protein
MYTPKGEKSLYNYPVPPLLPPCPDREEGAEESGQQNPPAVLAGIILRGIL